VTFNNTTPVNFFDTQSNGRASSSPFVDIFQPRDPTPQDITTATAINNYAIQQKWLNTTTNALWELKNYTTSAGVLYANWIMLANHALVTESLRDQTGIDVFPDVTNEINLVGDGVYVITTGTPSTNTMTVSVTGAITTLYTENTGTATPMAGNLNVVGTNGITTTGSGNTITITGTSAIPLTFDGDTGTATASANVIVFRATGFSGSSVSFSGALNIMTLTLTDALSNTILGYGAGNSSITGAGNIGLGLSNLKALTSGQGNSALAYGGLLNLTTGSFNIVIGAGSSTDGSGFNYTSSESHNILIANLGVTGDSGVIRIGTSAIQTSCYISGISGTTVTGAAVLCSTSGELGTISSSERYKENINKINFSDNFEKLNPVSFNYKKDEKKQLHYGLIAEEVEKIYPSLVLYGNDGLPESIAYHEMAALFIAEIQQLKKEIELLKEKNGNK
jgi:hypothetical protein